MTYIESLPDEERLVRNQRLSRSKSDYWKNLSDEERKKISVIKKEIWNNLTVEEKEKRSILISQKNRKRWKELPQIEQNKQLEVLFNGYRKYWDNLTPDEYNEWYNKRAEGQKLAGSKPTWHYLKTLP